MKISKPKVMHSNAGYYIGQSYFDVECNCDLPYERLSDYYRTAKDAEADLHHYTLERELNA